VLEAPAVDAEGSGSLMLPHQLVLPGKACRKLNHRIDTRNRAAGSGQMEYCYTCSLGYEMAITHLGDEEQADAFVQQLRQG
jgi:hypothetical protein